MEIDNSGLFKQLKKPETTICVSYNQNVCYMRFAEMETPTKQPRCHCCGATERLTSGECAYCRQY